MSARYRLTITNHALERWFERIGSPSTRSARGLIFDAYRRSVKVPYRHSNRLWSHGRGLLISRQRSRNHYRCTSVAVLVVNGMTVVTVMAMTPDALATVLVWAMTGRWEMG